MSEYLTLKNNFARLKPGKQASIRRAPTAEALEHIPAADELLQTLASLAEPTHQNLAGWRRVLWLLPYIEHDWNGPSLGEQMAKAGVGELRVQQVVTADGNDGFKYLRMLIQRLEPHLNVEKLGKTVFEWNPQTKNELMADYLRVAVPPVPSLSGPFETLENTQVMVSLKLAFDRSLTAGEQAQIRRAARPSDLHRLGSAYRLLPRELSAPDRMTVEKRRRWFQVVFILPFTAEGSYPKAPSLGKLLQQLRPDHSDEKVSDSTAQRLVQMARSDTPDDLCRLRQILRLLGEPKMDWSDFGKRLFRWGLTEKRRILDDYVRLPGKK